MSHSQLEPGFVFQGTDQDWPDDRRVVRTKLNEDGKRVRVIRLKKKKQSVNGSAIPSEMASMSELQAAMNGDAHAYARDRRGEEQSDLSTTNFFLKGRQSAQKPYEAAENE